MAEGGRTAAEVSQELGLRWGAMGTAEKRKYVEEAEKTKAERAAAMKGYEKAKREWDAEMKAAAPEEAEEAAMKAHEKTLAKNRLFNKVIIMTTTRTSHRAKLCEIRVVALTPADRPDRDHRRRARQDLLCPHVHPGPRVVPRRPHAAGRRLRRGAREEGARRARQVLIPRRAHKCFPMRRAGGNTMHSRQATLEAGA